MDILYFFKERTRFIRHFYETAGGPFRETMRKIEAGESPFDNPPHIEDGEPPYLTQWIEAEKALDLLGRTCLSMLSPSIQLYFRTWESELGIQWEKGERKRTFKKGFLQGYKTCFGDILGLSWDKCPADLALIEQITLARNRDQHPEKIMTMRVDHAKKDLEQHPHPFFMSETDRKIYADPEMQDVFWISLAVYVSAEKLYESIEETEKLATWLEEHILAVRYRR